MIKLQQCDDDNGHYVFVLPQGQWQKIQDFCPMLIQRSQFHIIMVQWSVIIEKNIRGTITKKLRTYFNCIEIQREHVDCRVYF